MLMTLCVLYLYMQSSKRAGEQARECIWSHGKNYVIHRRIFTVVVIVLLHCGSAGCSSVVTNMTRYGCR